MEPEKYLPYFRRALLAVITCCGYFFLRYFVEALVLAVFVNSDTLFEGYPPIVFVLIPLLSFLIFIPYCYECFLGDFVETKRYYETLADEEKFTVLGELKKCARTPEFIITRLVFTFLLWLLLGFFNMLVYTAMSVFCELFARRRWYNGRKAGVSLQPKKRPYALYLLATVLRYNLSVFGIIFLVGMVKVSIGSVWGIIGRALLVGVVAAISVTVFLFFYWRIRAIKVQLRLFKKLNAVCRQNGVRFRQPKGIYSALLMQKPLYFALEHKKICFDILLVPTLLRKTPLYFLGDGVIQRVRRFYFFKVEVFSRSSFMEYKLPPVKDGRQSIILLSPIPRQFYVGPVGNPSEGDNSSAVDNALIYSGTAFCNYIERRCSD